MEPLCGLLREWRGRTARERGRGWDAPVSQLSPSVHGYAARMAEIWVGILAVLVGALFCFRGSVALRAIIAIWGAFVGFSFGAAIVAGVSGEEVLAGPAGWIVAILLALLFGGLAYAFYALAVVITMGSVGYGLGVGLAALLGVTGDGVVLAMGIAGAIALAVLAFVTHLPHLLLVLVSAGAGAAVIVAGLLLLLGVVGMGAGEEAVRATLSEQWWWLLAYLALAVTGAAAQLRSPARPHPQSSWEASPARR